MRYLVIMLLLLGCGPLPDQPALQTYGTVFPACILLCQSKVSTATLGQGATQTSTYSTTKSVGNP